MKEFNALVLYHFEFDKNGNHYEGTKYRVSLGEFGLTEANGPLNLSLDPCSVVKVHLGFKNRKFYVIDVIK